MRYAVVGAFFLLLGGSFAKGQDASFTISGGYSNTQYSHATLPYERSGGYLDTEFLWRIHGINFPLLAGLGIGGNFSENRQDLPVQFSNGFVGTTPLYSDVGNFDLEARLAIPLPLSRSGLFVMPQLGMGLLVNSYAIDHPFTQNGLIFITTEYHDGAAFALRPGIQVGYSWGWGSAGAEVSYMAAWGDFGNLGSRAMEIRAGAFFRVKI